MDISYTDENRSHIDAPRAEGLLHAFMARSATAGGPLMAISPHYLLGNWAAQPALGSIDLARAARAAQSGSAELGLLTVFDGADPGYLIEWPAGGSRGASAAGSRCPADAFDHVLPGCSASIVATRRNAVRIARQDGHLLVSGEAGVGKRTLAASLLACSGRPVAMLDVSARGNWLDALDAAITEGQSIALLHADAMPDAHIGACLHLLELACARQLRVALTVTPNLPMRLQALVARLAWRLWIPPLRDRPEDIPEIIAAWPATRRGRPRRASAATLRWLWSRPWPGNVRELMQALNEVPGNAGNAGRPPPSKEGACRPPGQEPRALVQALQKRALVQTLARCGGNRSRAAVMLGLSRATLYRKMDQFGISTAGTHRRPSVSSSEWCKT